MCFHETTGRFICAPVGSTNIQHLQASFDLIIRSSSFISLTVAVLEPRPFLGSNALTSVNTVSTEISFNNVRSIA